MTTIFALLAASAFAQVPAGQPVSPAVNVDITPEGFDAVESLVPMFVPSGLALPFIESFSGECFWGVGTRTGIQLSGAQVSLAVNDVQIVPVPPTGYCGAGAQLDLHLSADIWLNDASTPFALYIEALCFGDTCDSWIDPFTALVDATVCVDLVTDPVTGALTLDASVDPDSLVVNLEGPGGLNGDDIHLNNCVVGDILGGLNLYDLVLPLLTGQIDSLLADQVASINESIADAVGGIGDSLVIAESFEVMEGSAIDLYLAPAAIGTDYNGLRFQLEGSAEAPLVHDCIARWDNGTSLETPSATPGVGEIPAVLSEPYHVSATIADEFVNQLFYAVWQTGILCQTA